jgi:hypothetical protein
MKIPILLSILFFLILGVAANIFYFKLDLMPFIGFLVLALIILGIVSNFFVKAKNKKKGIEGEPNAFIFPNKIAKGMKNVDLGIQYEASVLSSALLILGIVLFLVYYTFFTQGSWVMKGLIIFNSVCGIGLMAGMMITYYQQLIAYRESTNFIKQFAERYPKYPQASEDLYGDESYIKEDYKGLKGGN